MSRAQTRSTSPARASRLIPTRSTPACVRTHLSAAPDYRTAAWPGWSHATRMWRSRSRIHAWPRIRDGSRGTIGACRLNACSSRCSSRWRSTCSTWTARITTACADSFTKHSPLGWSISCATESSGWPMVCWIARVGAGGSTWSAATRCRFRPRSSPISSAFRRLTATDSTAGRAAWSVSPRGVISCWRCRRLCCLCAICAGCLPCGVPSHAKT